MFKLPTDGCCVTCGKPTTFVSYNMGYLECCSQACSTSRKERNDKIKKTKKERHGSETYNNRKSATQTTIEKYGVENVSQSDGIKDKKRQTLIRNYGVDNPLKSEEIKNKIRETCMIKYGVSNPSESVEVQDKRRASMVERYGVEYYGQSSFYRDFKEKLGEWVPLENKSDFEVYHMAVWRQTEKHRKKLFGDWDGLCSYTNEKLLTDVLDYNNPLYATIDHKISIFEGFKQGMLIHIIGGMENLCICSRIANSIKGIKTDFKI